MTKPELLALRVTRTFHAICTALNLLASLTLSVLLVQLLQLRLTSQPLPEHMGDNLLSCAALILITHVIVRDWPRSPREFLSALIPPWFMWMAILVLAAQEMTRAPAQARTQAQQDRLVIRLGMTVLAVAAVIGGLLLALN